MCPTVQIATQDSSFGEVLSGKLTGWGLSVIHQDEYLYQTPAAFSEGNVDVLLLDIRQQGDKALSWLAALKNMLADLEVLIINKPGEINAAMEGMRIGASDELTAPFDTETLKTKVLDAVRRREKKMKAKKGGFMRMLQDSMAAATFAQAGEYETALDFLDSKREEPDSIK